MRTRTRTTVRKKLPPLHLTDEGILTVKKMLISNPYEEMARNSPVAPNLPRLPQSKLLLSQTPDPPPKRAHDGAKPDFTFYLSQKMMPVERLLRALVAQRSTRPTMHKRRLLRRFNKQLDLPFGTSSGICYAEQSESPKGKGDLTSGDQDQDKDDYYCTDTRQTAQKPSRQACSSIGRTVPAKGSVASAKSMSWRLSF